MSEPRKEQLERLRRSAEASLFSGPGETDPALRAQAANGNKLPPSLAPFVEKVRHEAWKVTDEEVAALRGEWSDDALLEVIAAASFGAAGMRLDAALKAIRESATAGADAAPGAIPAGGHIATATS